MNDLQMYTQEQTAKLLGTSEHTVESLRRLGLISTIKIGRSFMFPYFAIDEFQHYYLNMDLSNEENMLKSKHEVYLKKLKEKSKGLD